jgi:hypothetical protein
MHTLIFFRDLLHIFCLHYDSRQHTGDNILASRPAIDSLHILPGQLPYLRSKELVFIFMISAKYNDPVILGSVLYSACRSMNERTIPRKPNIRPRVFLHRLKSRWSEILTNYELRSSSSFSQNSAPIPYLEPIKSSLKPHILPL